MFKTGWLTLKFIYSNNKSKFYLLLTGNLIIALLPSSALIILSYLVDSSTSILLKESNASIQFVITISVCYILSALILPNVLTQATSYLHNVIQYSIQISLSKKLMMKSASVHQEVIERPAYQDLLQSIRSIDGNKLVAYFTKNLGLVTSTIQLITTLTVLFSFYWMLPIQWIIVILPDIILKFRATRRNLKIYDDINHLNRRMTYFSDLLTGSKYEKEIRLLNGYDFLLKKFIEYADKFLAKTKSVNIKNQLDGSTGQFLFFVLHRGSILFAIFAVIDNKISIGEFTTFFFAGNTIFNAINTFNNNLSNMKFDSSLIQRLFNFLDEISVSPPQNIHTDKIVEIEFKNVSFSYKNDNVFALKNINIIFKSNEKVAIVGENGAGKTTFIRLLLGLSKPTTGDIYVNGQNIKELHPRYILSQAVAVFQDYNTFLLTIGENILLGDTNLKYDSDIFIEAIEKSNCKQVILKHSLGLDQPIGDLYNKGIDLSGGEKQKLALARSYLKEASIAVLDEPTASMDSFAEMKLYKQFQNYAKDQIAVIISHRLGSATLADKIIFLDKGEILEVGNHKQLLRENGAYHKLFHLQSSLYGNDVLSNI
ncbi:ABC transporter ATP-binding protein [Paenibacillus sp. FSL H8-0317]|uniref:ABC transporter ATP-binding protein n=1 Tax=Paenibacillus sp. FSL H8-0317 TaxID=2921385 RepID=UPI003255813A